MYNLKNEISKTLLSWKNGQEIGPTILEFYPTQRCNLTCRTCVQPQVYDKNNFELPDDEFVRIVREAIELGTKIFYIGGGGEPFCRRKLVLKLMQMIKKEGCHGSLTSNTTLLQERDIEMMVKIGWDDLHLSIDGPDAETCDYLRGEGTFQKATQVLRWLNEYKQKYRKKEPKLILNFVISQKNFRSIPDYIRFAGENKAGYLFFNHVIIHSPSFRYLQLSEEDNRDLNKIIREGMDLAEKLKLSTNLSEVVRASDGPTSKNTTNIDVIPRTPSLLSFGVAKLSRMLNKGNPKKAYCLKPWYHLVIQTNGEVGPCCIFQNHAVSIYRQSLKKIWTADYFPALRREMLSPRPPADCSGCPAGLREEDATLKKFLFGSRVHA